MDNRRIAGVMIALTIALLSAGCSTQFTYVDEAGNPLSVNARGEPVVAPETQPGRTAPVRSAPAVAGRSGSPDLNPAQPANPPWGVVVEGEARPAAARPAAARMAASASRVASEAAPVPVAAPAPAAAADDLPAPDPSWRVAPQEKRRPAPRVESPASGAGSGGKKIESSAGLGGPPAG